MWTVGEIKERTEGYFRRHGVPDPRLDADILVARVMGLRRLDLYLDLHRPLTEAQLAELRPLVKRRAGREPLQHILGRTEFCGLELKVDARALIPRPETEELFELAAAEAERADGPPERVLDLGTGCGALALALAARYPGAGVVATDASGAALALARENAAALGLAERVAFREGDWLAAAAGEAPFSLIVANPPYLTEAELAVAEPEVADYEPRRALEGGGAEGTAALAAILGGARDFLAPDGVLVMETGIAQAERLGRLAEEGGLRGGPRNDLSGRTRFFVARHG